MNFNFRHFNIYSPLHTTIILFLSPKTLLTVNSTMALTLILLPPTKWFPWRHTNYGPLLNKFAFLLCISLIFSFLFLNISSSFLPSLSKFESSNSPISFSSSKCLLRLSELESSLELIESSFDVRILFWSHINSLSSALSESKSECEETVGELPGNCNLWILKIKLSIYKIEIYKDN